MSQNLLPYSARRGTFADDQVNALSQVSKCAPRVDGIGSELAFT